MPSTQTTATVKQLRSLTKHWGVSTPKVETALKVKDLVEKLPAFNSAPQTKLENTTRAIEALFRHKFGVELHKHELNEPAVRQLFVGRPEEAVTLVMAIAMILNTHYGIGISSQSYEAPKKPEIPEGCNGYTVFEIETGKWTILHDSDDCAVHSDSGPFDFPSASIKVAKAIPYSEKKPVKAKPKKPKPKNPAPQNPVPLEGTLLEKLTSTTNE